MKHHSIQNRSDLPVAVSNLFSFSENPTSLFQSCSRLIDIIPNFATLGKYVKMKVHK